MEVSYKTIIEISREGFWMLDPARNLVDVNIAYCRLSGYPRDELLTMHASELDGAGDGWF